MKSLALLFALLCSSVIAAPVPIFDGKTLDGWDYDPAIWRVEDGMITGGSTTGKIKANYFVCTKKSYGNFELKLKIKCSGDPKTGLINSGIQIRSVRVPGGAHMSGYQVDCGAGWFGKIYDEFRRNKVIAMPVDQAALDKVVDVFGWNEYRIRAEGPRIQAWINGVLAIDYTETDPHIALDGQIGPQVHSGGVALVQFKDVTIEELPATPNAPTWETVAPAAPRGNPKTTAPSARTSPEPAEGRRATAPASQNAPGKKRDTSYNAVQGTAKTAAEQAKLFHLPEGYEIELVVQESEGLGKFVSVYFDQRGRMWTQTAFEYPVDGNENAAAADALYQSRAKDKVLVYPRAAINAPLPAGGLTNPTVFADGLAIPLGILPWGSGDTCYIQHGHDLKLFKDTDGDGKSDTSEVLLTGFGVQDSHLFPHQFTRAPGGWIWMAQGLFNNSKAQKPGTDKAVDWPKCSMAKMRPDGTRFEVTSTGPNNIWGLVITGEGEAFIQEANDYGYPVMPFHEYAYYPGGMEALKKSHQPEFPPAAEFRMGGTGLSGLALGEGAFRKLTPTLHDDGLCMFVANPITSKVQTIAMHRDGPYWKLEQAADLITCDDPFFRPVGMTNGPDGCIYIVDWYNKIISHNEVARTHPDRDKTRGRIWRVKAKSAPRIEVPDFTKLSGDELIAKLGAEPLAQSHLAWQAIADRGLETPAPKLREIVRSNAPVAKRVAAIWALNGLFALENEDVIESVRSPDAHLRREAVCASVSTPEALRKLAGGETTGSTGTIAMRPGRGAGVGPRDSGAPSGARSDLGGSPVVSPPAKFRQPSGLLAALVADPDPRVRAEVIRLVGSDATLKLALTVASGDFPPKVLRAIDEMLRFAREPLAEPTAPSSRNGKPIKVREAYDREFERYLVRMFLEQHPDAVAKFLDSEAARELPIEARLLASLALEPRASAARVAKLLPQLQRAPGQEEVLRLAQFPDEPGVGDSLREVLSNPVTRNTALEALFATRTRLDATKLTPFLTDAAQQLLAANDDSSVQLGIQLAGAFQLARTEDALVALAEDGLPAGHGRPASRLSAPAGGTPAGRDRRDVCLPALRALSQIGSARSELFASLAKSAPDQSLRAEAVLALAASKAPDAAERLLKLWPDLQPTQRHASLERLASSKPGAKGLIGAIRGGSVKKDELDGPTVEKLQAVLGDDPELAALLGELASNFRPVLALDGSDEAYVETTLSFDGPLTVETWVRLAPGLGNMDGILGVPGQLDVNFFGGKFRVYAGGTVHDAVVATKAMTPEMWTHVAAVRDAEGHWQLYLDGQLDPAPSKPAPDRLENVRIAWTGAKGGTQGALAEYRLWNRARTGEEISRDFDRSIVQAPGLVFSSAATPWGKLHAGAKVTKTSDFPPILTADEATALDAKFAKYRALAAQPGDATRGKTTAMLCSACHLFKGQGGNIGPDLSGVGAMGVEAILRNILTPNAAMENGYRIYRVELKGGDLVDAFFVSEDKEAVVIRQPGTPDRRIARGDIRSTKFLRRSLMPEGLLDVLPTEQASDLLAYLLSLK